MSTSTIDQKAYLQKYLSGPSREKKKKKKIVKGKGIKLIDDDIDLSKLRPLDAEELDLLGESEDAPVVAGIIDERPEEVRKLEQFNMSSKWRVVAQDDGFNSNLQIEEIKKGIKEVEKENEIVFGKMYSDSEEEQKKDSDASPPRKYTKTVETHKAKKPQNNSDSDFSPPRKNIHESSKKISHRNDDSDVSPPRRHDIHKSKDRVRKTSRWGDADESASNARSDKRSPSHKEGGTSSASSRQPRKQSSDDKSRKGKDNDSDPSPPRKSKKDHSRKRAKSPDSYLSPPRKSKSKHQHVEKYNSKDNHHEKSSKKSKFRKDSDSDSDLSPPRNKSPKRLKSPDSDESPQRKQIPKGKYAEKERSRHTTSKNDRRHGERSRKLSGSDSDLSPPRKQPSKRSKSPAAQKSNKYNSDSDPSPPRRESSKDTNRYQKSSDSPPPSNKKMAKTLEGKLAGLQDARQLREENVAFRKREDEAFRRLGDDISGRNAQVVSRKGKRETSEDRQKLKEKAERQKELDEKYNKWSKGLKQVEAQEARVADYMHEASKPVARHRDDADLENSLRDVERAGDPMLQYIRDRRRDRGELPPEKPMYKGNFPPNRFNIRPGYRWDGVDRSNGYEKKYFEQHAKRKAQEEEAYKWSTEDL